MSCSIPSSRRSTTKRYRTQSRKRRRGASFVVAYRGEWETIENLLLETWDYDEDDPDRLHWEVDKTPFDASATPGYCDGDYPRWAQQSMDEVILEDPPGAYGAQEASVHIGLFWLILHEQAEALADALRLRGYHVEHEQFLRGW